MTGGKLYDPQHYDGPAIRALLTASVVTMRQVDTAEFDRTSEVLLRDGAVLKFAADGRAVIDAAGVAAYAETVPDGPLWVRT